MIAEDRVSASSTIVGLYVSTIILCSTQITCMAIVSPDMRYDTEWHVLIRSTSQLSSTSTSWLLRLFQALILHIFQSNSVFFRPRLLPHLPIIVRSKAIPTAGTQSTLLEITPPMRRQSRIVASLLVLTCANSGVWASNRKFNILDDLLAFPQVNSSTANRPSWC